MAHAAVRCEDVTFKTYLTGRQDQHPIFLEHRVYQGSSGAVYPYGVTDTLLDKWEMKTYRALILENDYLKVMILPQLGGRVHRAYDKVNGRDFVYFNQVIKPALVGLLGPWISGGIEFNWPQHHRPTTFMPTDYEIKTNDDGSASVIVGEREPMHGLSVTTVFTLYEDKALLEIKSRVVNTGSTAKSFLWWSNPAVKGGDQHQSVFPPDVTAVFDHGKRAVIDFPIAHGEYYKVRYDGEDISRYKNLPVPTSYMAWRSDYDFVGAYCHDEKGGLLHYADHHVAPGKKQWTWGYGDFGRAWDRNLTDEDGPYIELMTGIYTDNQPDFTWIEPGEHKEFVQNFMPYSALGMVHNANDKAALKLERTSKGLELGVYAVTALKGTAVLKTEGGAVINSKDIELAPCKAELWQIQDPAVGRLRLILLDESGNELLSYLEHIKTPTPLPETAPNPPLPCEVTSTDEAYFIGQHLEQYHHASRTPDSYYRRGLEIDPLDYRCNTALGNMELGRCNYEEALAYADAALKRCHMLNRNPQDGSASLLKAHALFKLGKEDEAYDEYFRATWSYNAQSAGYTGLSFISCRRGDLNKGFEFAERALQTQSCNPDAVALKCYCALASGLPQAQDIIGEAVAQSPLNAVLHCIKALFDPAHEERLAKALNGREINYISVTEFLCKLGRTDLARDFLNRHDPVGAIASLIKAALTADQALKSELCKAAPSEFASFVRFPNLPFERDMLGTLKDNPFALHLCASFDYSHRLYQKAAALWEQCLTLDPDYVEALRGLGIYSFNKLKDKEKALQCYSKALKNAHSDERILFEHDLLLKLSGADPLKRLSILEEHNVKNCLRDDLKAEYVTLLNIAGRIDEAAALLKDKIFHVWEGGEGRVTGQYAVNAVYRAHRLLQEGKPEEALKAALEGLSFPENLGEGKLVVQTDNDLYFTAALCAKALGQEAQCRAFLDKACAGDTALSEQRYYNDLPCDYLFYHALALRALGKEAEAKSLLCAMQKWSYEAYDSAMEEDFFAVSLPDLVVLDRDPAIERRENCLVMRLLSALGLGDEALFEQTASDLKALQPSNFKVYLYQSIKAGLNF